jgi:hypothetical protein
VDRLSQPRGRLLGSIVIAVIPAVLAVAAWCPFLLEQLQAARPYSWVLPPAVPDLLEAVFGSVDTLWISVVLIAAGLLALKQGHARLGAMVRDPARQPLHLTSGPA